MTYIMAVSICIHFVLAVPFALALSLCTKSHPGQHCRILNKIALLINFRYGRLSLGSVHDQPLGCPLWLFLFHAISLFISTSWTVLVISTTVDDYLLVSQNLDIRMCWVIHSTLMVILTATMTKECLLSYLCAKRQTYLQEQGVNHTAQLTNQHFASQQLSLAFGMQNFGPGQ